MDDDFITIWDVTASSSHVVYLFIQWKSIKVKEIYSLRCSSSINIVVLFELIFFETLLQDDSESWICSILNASSRELEVFTEYW